MGTARDRWMCNSCTMLTGNVDLNVYSLSSSPSFCLAGWRGFFKKLVTGHYCIAFRNSLLCKRYRHDGTPHNVVREIAMRANYILCFTACFWLCLVLSYGNVLFPFIGIAYTGTCNKAENNLIVLSYFLCLKLTATWSALKQKVEEIFLFAFVFLFTQEDKMWQAWRFLGIPIYISVNFLL